MANNPQTPTIILFAKKEIKTVDGRLYCVITDKAGQEHKINDKRQELWGIFNAAIDAEPFLLVYESYNKIQYVADAKPITEDLLKVAIRNLGIKLADMQTEERNRSTALSYAKDMLVGGNIELATLYEQATKNYQFIKGVMQP